jgi:EPS-associated MarR family transcriptional regulator
MADKVSLSENMRFTVLRLLQAKPEMTQRELAQALGVSLGKTNYCLKALLEKGLLKVHNFQTSQRKLAYAYLLTPSGIAEKAALTGRFLQYKIAEFEALKAEIESLQDEADISQPPLQARRLSLRAERGNP